MRAYKREELVDELKDSKKWEIFQNIWFSILLIGIILMILGWTTRWNKLYVLIPIVFLVLSIDGVRRLFRDLKMLKMDAQDIRGEKK